MIGDSTPLSIYPSTTTRQRVFDLIDQERQRQITKLGTQDHSLVYWMTILGEEFGEAEQAIYEATTRANPSPERTLQDERSLLHDVVKELTQTAAVATAILEDLLEHPDRTAAQWRQDPWLLDRLSAVANKIDDVLLEHIVSPESLDKDNHCVCWRCSRLREIMDLVSI